ncbi:hypothetical protein C8R41DRAFT_913920 [Lentinula lateritia]|uniref:Zn(2)-C6 fungal-type domain-containing protein n=1 Tax=Lentinula lateritia TaxID=40482 RepID=A0ABQ8W1D4_9AGAR|nr:hypothetical protein C8R41DRAFT_913920 [Lentinula lateritia]
MSDSTHSMMHDESTLFTSDFGSEMLNYTGGIDLSDLCLVDDFYSHSGLSSPLFPAYPTSLNPMPTSPSPSPRLPTPILPVPRLQPTSLGQSTPISPPSTASPAISPTPISKAFKCGNRGCSRTTTSKHCTTKLCTKCCQTRTDLQCPHHQKNSQKPSTVPQLALVPIPQPGSLTESNSVGSTGTLLAQSDPLPIRTLSKQMPQDMAVRFKQQQERKEQKRCLTDESGFSHGVGA